MRTGNGVTIKDIALKAGVSTATVSRVINHDMKVSEKTREKVEACLKETGYRVNPIARSLRSRRTHSIGILAPEFQNDFFMAVAEGIEEVLRTRGYTTFIVNSHEDKNEEGSRIELLIEKQVDGVIIIPTTSDGSHYHALDKEGIPYVLVDRFVDSSDSDAVLTDNRKGAYEAVAACIADGAERIAFIGADNRITPARERYEGYIHAMTDHGMAIEQSLIAYGDMHIASGYEAMKLILEADPSIEYVFIINLFMRIGAEKFLAEAQPGSSVKIAAFDLSPISSLFRHSFVTVRQPLEQIGTEAAQLLLGRIAHEQLDCPSVIRLEPELIFYDSL